MKIQNISSFAYYNKNLNSTAKSNNVSFEGLFSSEKKDYLLKARSFQRNAKYMTSVDRTRKFDLQKDIFNSTNEAKRIVEEAKKEVNEVYALASYGLFDKGGDFSKDDRNIEFVRRASGRGVDRMMEYDNDGNLLRETKFSNNLPKEIRKYNEEDMDIIKFKDFNCYDMRIWKNSCQKGKNPNNYSAKYVIDFENQGLKQVLKSVSKASNTTQIGEILDYYMFNEESIKSYTKNYFKNVDGKEHYSAKHIFSMVEDGKLKETDYDVTVGQYGEKRIGKRFCYSVNSDEPKEIEENYNEKNSSKYSDTKYRFSDGKLSSVAQNYRENSIGTTKADSIFYYKNEKPDYCIIDCAMKKTEGSFKQQKRYIF